MPGIAESKTTLRQLAEAIDGATTILKSLSAQKADGTVFQDLHDRLAVARCFYATMRNMVAWIESVHGYTQANTTREKQEYHAKGHSMVMNELGNTRNLLRLWNDGKTRWMPVSKTGESLHIYGENFGELLENKIMLMELYSSDEPHIDPNYMWRMSNTSVVASSV